MILIGIVLLVAVVGISVRVGLLEFSIGTLIAAAVVWQVVIRALIAFDAVDSIPSHQAALVTYIGVIAILLLLSFAVFERRIIRELSFRDALPLLIWSATFLGALHYCHSWPDFYQNGERLRDYALLAASVKSPVIPIEPWMSTATINYYIYWYRFGHMLSTIGGYPVWELYHLLVAFSIATYTAMIFRLLTALLGFDSCVAFFASLAIAFGSNVKGILDWYAGDLNWWGPSRVVKGAINEFPAWSFLLGDLHPHYANLAAIPFLILILGAIWTSAIALGEKCLYGILVGLAGHFFLFGSNAWEIPMWWGILASLLFVVAARPGSTLLAAVQSCIRAWWSSLSSREAVFAVASLISGFIALVLLVALRKHLSTPLFLGTAVIVAGFSILFIQPRILVQHLGKLASGINRRRAALITGVTAIFIMGCVLGSRHIVPEGGILRLVRAPIQFGAAPELAARIELTTVTEMLLHWGTPIIVIAMCTPFLLEGIAVKAVVSLSLFISLFLGDAALFIFLLAFLQLPRIAKDLSEPLLRAVIGNGIVLSGLGLILLPEFVFLDDPYGGENERMNTIFKIYTTAWFLMHVGAAFMIQMVIEKMSNGVTWPHIKWIRRASLGVLLVILFIMTGFFEQTVAVRRLTNSHVEPYIRGLSEVAAKFPGSRETIDFLTVQPSTTVLEAQGNAYDYTSFVSTLSGQTAFLGWSNHVGLLTKRYDEVTRREKVTESFYKAGTCQERREVMSREAIGVVVVGTLEKKKYPNLSDAGFSCLSKVFEQGDYQLYR